MAASPDTARPFFSWPRASLHVERTFPEWEGRVEEEHHPEVRFVVGGIRGQFRARAFDSNGHKLMAAVVTASEADTDAGRASFTVALPGGGEERWILERKGGCGCG